MKRKNANNGLVFDSSSMMTAERCKRRFYWSYVRHLKPVDRQLALEFGSAIHLALENWYTYYDVERALQEFHENWTDLLADNIRTHENAEKMLRAYFVHYSHEPFKIISLEHGFRVPLGDFEFCGRYDAVIIWDGLALVFDHKTTARLTQSYFKQFRPNFQVSGYIWAARRTLDIEVSGMMINLLHVLTKSYNFMREIIPREQWELDAFEDIAIAIMKDLSQRDQTTRDDWPECWAACGDYGGCPYRDLCITNEPERLVEMQFKVEKWDPLVQIDNKKLAVEINEQKSKMPFLMLK